jgi:FkbM family methyltransferase
MLLGLRDKLGWATSEAVQYLRSGDDARAAQRRALFFDLAGRFTPVVAVDSALGRLYVSTQDRFISRETFIRGAYDRAAIAAVLSAVDDRLPGWDAARGLIVEVGANIGTTTLILAQHGPVLAFEPVPANVALLRQNVIANGLGDRVDVRDVALSDVAGTVVMELNPINCGDHRVRLTTDPGTDAELDRVTIEVTAARLDDLCPQIPSLVWIDAQGHEAQILAGAPRLLASAAPIVIEYWPYGLQRAGGLELLERLVAEHFTTVVDTSRGDGDRRELPAGSLASLRSRYPTSRDYTDLLLLE